MWKLDPKEVIHALLIVVLAAAVGLIHNALSADGLPLFSRTPRVAPIEQAAAMEIRTTTLTEAKALFDRGEAIFIDARPAEAYAEGHIVGAVSLPYDTFEECYPEVADQLPVDLLLITYCDGTTCAKSAELALLLNQIGYSHLSVFFGGWTEWKNAGYPVFPPTEGKP